MVHVHCVFDTLFGFALSSYFYSSVSRVFCNAFVDSLAETYVFDILHDDSYGWMYEKGPSLKSITSLLKPILEYNYQKTSKNFNLLKT